MKRTCLAAAVAAACVVLVAGVSKVYVSDLSGAPRELTGAGAQLTGAFWSADGAALLVPRSGDLWRVPVDGSPAAPVWTTPPQEQSFTASPDRTRVAFVRDRNDLFTRSIVDDRETKIATENGITAISWSPDGQW